MSNAEPPSQTPPMIKTIVMRPVLAAFVPRPSKPAVAP